MRDLALREALTTMAEDAAARLRELVAAGEEIPYDVSEGEGSSLVRYTPRIERFIRDHSNVIAALDSFGTACAALDSAELAGPYLAELGVQVPPESSRRAELAGLVFCCRLWQGSTDFSLEGGRLEQAMDEVEAGGDAGAGEVEVVVPLRGLQMSVERLQLATATIVRSDVVEVPADARRGEGSGRAAWEPQFVAVVRSRFEAGAAGNGEEPARPAVQAVEAFRELVTTLRLFKSGGVALGPHAWTRSAADRWRRVATGEGRPQPGGYRLADEELPELQDFSRAVASRPARGRTLARAISRFEAGSERRAAVEALNDHLLSLRFLLEGGGPAGLGLAMRVAALCAEPEERAEVRATVERALSLERELWSGEPAEIAGRTPADVAGEIEELARAILKDAACGHLGSDLRATADEILLADGLAAGEGTAAAERGETSEWGAEPGAAGEPAAPPEPVQVFGGGPRNGPQRPSEPQPRAQAVATEPAGNEQEDEPVVARLAHRDRSADRETDREEHRRAVADRVAYLFPRPETTDWSVRELEYSRRRSEMRAS